MAGSIWGEVFRVSTWGESHGEGVGVVAVSYTHLTLPTTERV